MTLTASPVNAHAIDVSWTPVATPPTRYELYRDGAYLGPSTTTQVGLTGLASETRYCFVVYAIYFPFGVQSRSNEDCATTPPDAPPTAPTGLSASAVSPARIALAWTASSDDIGVTGYRVERDGALLAQASGPAFDDRSAFPATTYCYQVVAIDTGGQPSAPSNRACLATPPDTAPPSAPASLHAEGGATAVTLTWTESLDDGAVAVYRLERDGASLPDVTPPAAGPQVSATDAGVASFTQYCYVVRAVDRAGNVSDPSNTACTTTSWERAVLAGPGTAFDYVGERNALVLDGAGRLHVAYSWQSWQPDVRAYGPMALRYGSGSPGAWSESELASAVTSQYRPVLAWLSGAAPAAAFVDSLNGFAWFVPSPGAAAERVAIEVAYGVSLAADATAVARIAYGRSTALRLATRSADAWSVEDVPGTGASHEPVMRVDAFGRPNIVYADPVARALRHARFDGSSWAVTTIEPTGAAGWSFVALALDATGASHVSYYDGTASVLKYATNRSGQWIATVVDGTPGSGLRTSIAVGAAGQAHVSYVDFASGRLKYASNPSGTWRAYVLDDAGVGPTGWGDTSIAVGGDGRVHIVYHAGSALRYATRP